MSVKIRHPRPTEEVFCVAKGFQCNNFAYNPIPKCELGHAFKGVYTFRNGTIVVTRPESCIAKAGSNDDHVEAL